MKLFRIDRVVEQFQTVVLEAKSEKDAFDRAAEEALAWEVEEEYTKDINITEEDA